MILAYTDNLGFSQELLLVPLLSQQHYLESTVYSTHGAVCLHKL